MSEPVIRVEHVSKEYRLGAIGGTTLRADLQRAWAKLRHKEDPNSQIGTDQSHIGEKFFALDDVSFEVQQGEALGIIGHNGAGKSTMLKLLSRVTAPTKGRIMFKGRIASMLEVGTGFHGELTGRENVYMNGAILGMTKKEISRKMDAIVSFAEMEQFIDTPVKRYSSGMYVKLAFAVAAHLDAEIMIMDEVLAVGDMKFQQKCLGKMGDAANNEGRTILYVSHNMNTIKKLCTRCMVLDHGRKIFDGDTNQAINLYTGICKTSPKAVDFSKMKHLDKTLNGIKITRMVSMEDGWSFPLGSKIRYTLHCKATKDLQDVSFRTRLYSANDTSITILKAENLFSCRSGEELEIPIEADVSNLVPGVYHFTPSLYAVNEFGGQEFYDHIAGAITFEIREKEGFNQNMVWDPYYWGYITFPPLKDLRAAHVK